MAWIYKRGGVWWIGWRHGGKQFLRSTEETEKVKAQAELEKIDSLTIASRQGTITGEYFALLTGTKTEKVRADAFFQKWITEGEQSGVCARTIEKYKQAVREFSAHSLSDSTDICLDQITPEHVGAFLTEKATRSAPGTVKLFRRILSSVFLRAHNLGHIRGNPVAAVRVNRKEQRNDTVKKRPFTLAEIQELHAKAGPFWQFMITAGFFTGQSMGDLIMLERGQVDMDQNVIRLNEPEPGK